MNVDTEEAKVLPMWIPAAAFFALWFVGFCSVWVREMGGEFRGFPLALMMEHPAAIFEFFAQAFGMVVWFPALGYASAARDKNKRRSRAVWGAVIGGIVVILSSLT
jgi:hypothetical protein